MTEQEILDTLNNCNDGYYCTFVELGQAYSFLIDARLNVFIGPKDRWIIAIERLGYNPRADAIILDINYFGNCMTNLEICNDRPTNNYSIHPIDFDNFNETIENEILKSNAAFWLVRGKQVGLSHDKQVYTDAGIVLEELEPNELRAEEVGRLVVSQNRDLFRATDSELYKSIPSDLNKILVLDEWFHKDFLLQTSPTMADEHLRQIFEFNKNLTGLGEMSFESFAQSMRQQLMLNNEWNRAIWENNRPSSYETWRLIAKVITTNAPEEYKPSLEPNTHWENWPDSGSL
jgi:hypothetical protein